MFEFKTTFDKPRFISCAWQSMWGFTLVKVFFNALDKIKLPQSNDSFILMFIILIVVVIPIVGSAAFLLDCVMAIVYNTFVLLRTIWRFTFGYESFCAKIWPILWARHRLETIEKAFREYRHDDMFHLDSAQEHEQKLHAFSVQVEHVVDSHAQLAIAEQGTLHPKCVAQHNKLVAAIAQAKKIKPINLEEKIKDAQKRFKTCIQTVDLLTNDELKQWGKDIDGLWGLMSSSAQKHRQDFFDSVKGFIVWQHALREAKKLFDSKDFGKDWKELYCRAERFIKTLSKKGSQLYADTLQLRWQELLNLLKEADAYQAKFHGKRSEFNKERMDQLDSYCQPVPSTMLTNVSVPATLLCCLFEQERADCQLAKTSWEERFLQSNASKV